MRVPRPGMAEPLVPEVKTGIPWGVLPLEMGCGSGMTCKRRMLQWMEANVFDRLLQRIVEDADQRQRLNKKHLPLDSSLAPAKKGARRPERIRRTEGNAEASIIC